MRKKIINKIASSSEGSVNLENMEINDDEIEEIASKILHLRPNLHTVFLNNNFIGDKGAMILERVFLPLTQLKNLDLQFNQIDREGAKAIVRLQLMKEDMDVALHGNKITDVSVMEQIKNEATSEIKKQNLRN